MRYPLNWESMLCGCRADRTTFHIFDLPFILSLLCNILNGIYDLAGYITCDIASAIVNVVFFFLYVRSKFLPFSILFPIRSGRAKSSLPLWHGNVVHMCGSHSLS
ncbi:unnamed protein product [Camellia sinensis]